MASSAQVYRTKSLSDDADTTGASIRRWNMVFPVKTAYKILRDHEKELLGVFKLIEAIE